MAFTLSKQLGPGDDLLDRLKVPAAWCNLGRGRQRDDHHRLAFRVDPASAKENFFGTAVPELRTVIFPGIDPDGMGMSCRCLEL